MNRLWRFSFADYSCRTLRLLLAPIWVISILIGAAIAFSDSRSLLPVIRSVVSADEVSLFQTFLVRLTPILFLAFFFSLRQLIPIVTICSLRIFLFSFTGAYVVSVLNASAWLVYFLVFSCDLLSLSVLWWLLNRLFTEDSHPVYQDTVFASITVILATLLEYKFIVPFLARLI